MYTEKEEKYYCSMNQKKLLKLSDKELTWAIFVRTDHLLSQMTRSGADEKQLPQPIKVANRICSFYNSVYEHPNLEKDELGMRFYLGGYSREKYVPLISKYLGIIGAHEHKAVLDEFFAENNINVHDLSQFALYIEGAYHSQAKRYNFEDTDEKLRSLPLTTLLAQYIRENIGCFAEDTTPAAPQKPSIIEVFKRKARARTMLKTILTALHEKRFDDVVALVTESTLNAADIEEFIQGTVEDNGFNRLDKYIAKNVCMLYVNGDRTCIEYYLSADGNQDLPLCLILDLIEGEDGTVTSVLDISPN